MMGCDVDWVLLQSVPVAFFVTMFYESAAQPLFEVSWPCSQLLLPGSSSFVAVPLGLERSRRFLHKATSHVNW